MVVPSTGTTHARTVFTALTAHGLTFGFVDHAVAIRVQPIKHFARTGGEFISADRAITIGVELCEHSFPAFAFTALTHFFEPGHQGFTFGAHFLAAGVGMRRGVVPAGWAGGTTAAERHAARLASRGAAVRAPASRAARRWP